MIAPDISYKTIVIELGNPVYDSRENCNAIIVTETNTLTQGCKNSFIPSSITNIGEKAFLGVELTSVYIDSQAIVNQLTAEVIYPRTPGELVVTQYPGNLLGKPTKVYIKVGLNVTSETCLTVLYKTVEQVDGRVADSDGDGYILYQK